VDERPDPEIARDAVSALKTQLPFSSEHIKVVVKNGVVTLEGQVEWRYQKQTAENAVPDMIRQRHRGISNFCRKRFDQVSGDRRVNHREGHALRVLHPGRESVRRG